MAFPNVISDAVNFDVNWLWIAVEKLWITLEGRCPKHFIPLKGRVLYLLLCNMATAGYSGTPLLKKLGIKPQSLVLLVNKPDDYFDLLQADISEQLCKKNQTPDFVHLFVKNHKEFENEMKKIKVVCKQNPNAVVWVSWYKKAAKIPTDVTEDVIRNYALKNDLVDVKVCAVSDLWSGLKLVVPVAKR